MPATFVDTSFWLAFADAKDSRHHRAADWMHSFTGRLVTSTDVLDETITLLLSRCSHAVAVQVGDRIQRPEELDLVEIDPAIREAAWALFRSRSDKTYSMTDCTSFVVMRRLGLADAATFDADFVQEGFRTVP